MNVFVVAVLAFFGLLGCVHAETRSMHLRQQSLSSGGGCGSPKTCENCLKNTKCKWNSKPVTGISCVPHHNNRNVKPPWIVEPSKCPRAQAEVGAPAEAAENAEAVVDAEAVEGNGFVMVDAGSSGSKIMSFDQFGNVAPKRAIETDCFKETAGKDDERDESKLRGISAIGAYGNGECGEGTKLKTKVDDADQTTHCGDGPKIPCGNSPKLSATQNPKTVSEYKKRMIQWIRQRHENRCELDGVKNPNKEVFYKETCKMKKQCLEQGQGHDDKCTDSGGKQVPFTPASAMEACKTPVPCKSIGKPKNADHLSIQATAGMRLIPLTINTAVWGEVCGKGNDDPFAAANDGYDFATISSGKCGTIPGTQEAMYEYVASVLNRPDHSAVGTFTVGGASAQIAFPLKTPEILAKWQALITKLKKQVFKDNCKKLTLPAKEYEGEPIPFFADSTDCSKDFISVYTPAQVSGMFLEEVANKVNLGNVGIAVVSFLGLEGNSNGQSSFVAGGMDAIGRYADKFGCEMSRHRTASEHCRFKENHVAVTADQHCKHLKTEAACTQGNCVWVACTGPPGCEEHKSEALCNTGIDVKLAPVNKFLAKGHFEQLPRIPEVFLKMTVCKWDPTGSDDKKLLAKTAAQCNAWLEGELKQDKMYLEIQKWFHNNNLQLTELSYNTNNVHPVANFYNEKSGNKAYSDPLLKDAVKHAGIKKGDLDIPKLTPKTRKQLEAVEKTLRRMCQAICDNLHKFETADGMGYKGKHSCFKCMFMAKWITSFFPRDTNGNTAVEMPDLDVATGMKEAAKKSFKSLRGEKQQTITSAYAIDFPKLYANPNFDVPIQFHSTTWVDGVAATFGA